MTVEGWPWRPDLCPADLHFGEYLLSDGLAPLNPVPRIIHVGTGLHHHVGLLLGSMCWEVLGLTVSSAEVEAFHALTNRPAQYSCFLQDVRSPNYEIDPGWLPVDFISLFHLGEPPDRVDGRSERDVIECALRWAHEVGFYTGSAAFDRVAPLIDALVTEGVMHKRHEFKSLVAYGSGR